MENYDSKVEYLLLLEELFKKDKLIKIYSKFLSDRLKEIGLENISERYQEIASTKILTNEEINLGKKKV